MLLLINIKIEESLFPSSIFLCVCICVWFKGGVLKKKYVSMLGKLVQWLWKSLKYTKENRDKDKNLDNLKAKLRDTNKLIQRIQDPHKIYFQVERTGKNEKQK